MPRATIATRTRLWFVRPSYRNMGGIGPVTRSTIGSRHDRASAAANLVRFNPRLQRLEMLVEVPVVAQVRKFLDIDHGLRRRTSASIAGGTRAEIQTDFS